MNKNETKDTQYLYCSISRKQILLCDEIAKGGQGTIFRINKPGLVAKIYHNNIPRDQINKLNLMLKYPPSTSLTNKNHPSIVWPVDLIERGDGQCIGFLMPELTNSKSLLHVYNHKLRKKILPTCNWYYLHIIAQNIALILQTLHSSNYIVGDLKPENILVRSSALISIIDVDSFQIVDPITKKLYRCDFTSEEYTPPEMLGLDLRKVDRTDLQDRFGLAIIIWLLLFGSHPFAGKWLRDEEDPPNINERIKHGYWIAAPDTPITPTPLTIPFDSVHPKIQNLFHRCFTDGYQNIQCRPSAEEWFQGLKIAVADLTSCSSVNSHYFAKSVGICHWCNIKKLYGTEFFSGDPEPLNQSSRLQRKTLYCPLEDKFGAESASRSMSSSKNAQSKRNLPNTSPLPASGRSTKTHRPAIFDPFRGQTFPPSPQGILTGDIFRLIVIGTTATTLAIFLFFIFFDIITWYTCQGRVIRILKDSPISPEDIDILFLKQYPDLDSNDPMIKEWCEIARQELEKLE